LAALKAIHYINQFYAGIGGETMADIGLQIIDGKKGPGMGLEKLWKGEMQVVKTIVCGDNFINKDENFESVVPEIKKIIDEVKPDVFIAGPAFNAGRYGVACAKMADYVRKEFGIPSVTGMWHENPAISMYVKDNYIISTSETATGMTKSLPAIAALAIKLAKREKIKAARFEGYIRTGHRYNEYNEKTGAERVVDILLKKLNNQPYVTEVPLRGFETVSPAPKVTDLKHAKIALLTTGGLVPVGNPDKIRQAFATSYGRYSMLRKDSLDQGVYESIHGGYDTTWATADPHRLVPLDAVRALEKEGVIGGVYEYFFTTCGVGTNIDSSKAMGKSIAEELKKAGVSAALMTST
jgi:glycine reductase